jgi:hypothetical protein
MDDRHNSTVSCMNSKNADQKIRTEGGEGNPTKGFQNFTHGDDVNQTCHDRWTTDTTRRKHKHKYLKREPKIRTEEGDGNPTKGFRNITQGDGLKQT